MQRVLASHIRISNSRRAPPPSTRRGGACGACGPPAWRARAADSRLLVRVESSRGGADGVSLGTRRWLATGPMHFVPAACCACAPRAVPVAWCGDTRSGKSAFHSGTQYTDLCAFNLELERIYRPGADRGSAAAAARALWTVRHQTQTDTMPCGWGCAAGSSGARATRL